MDGAPNVIKVRNIVKGTEQLCLCFVQLGRIPTPRFPRHKISTGICLKFECSNVRLCDRKSVMATF